MKRALPFLILLILFNISLAALRDIPYRQQYETKEFSANFSPVYPLVIGRDASININSSLEVQEIIVHLPDGQKVVLKKEKDKWTGFFNVSEKFKEGWQPIYIYIRHKVPIGYKALFDQLLEYFKIKTEVRYRSELYARRIWVRAFAPLPPIKKEPAAGKFPSFEAFIPSPEALVYEVVTPEAHPIIIKGSRFFSFSSKSIEGSKEGFLPGTSREESLRLNISGKVSDTEINANFLQTSTIGTTQVSSREEKVSILLKRGSTEAYFGDFTADLDETEFARLNKVLSGVKLSGNYERLNFKALASTPQGQSKIIKVYGDGTQGPYNLGYKTVIDSERVYVDGVIQKRGTDYEIDYNAGTVTFKNKTIIKTQIIEIYFDYRSTTYQHATYAVRSSAKINPNLNLGVTWIDDSDLKTDALNIYQTSSTEAPQSHYILGMDGSINLGKLLSAQGELAYSEKNLNILSAYPLKSIGRAAKLETSSEFGPFELKTNIKRIGPKFEPAAEALPKQDLTEYGGLLNFKPNDLFFSSINYDNEKYAQANTVFKNINRNGRIMLTPNKLPSLRYQLDELEESNDPVPPYTPINRLTTKNSWELTHTLGILNLSAKTGSEVRANRTASPAPNGARASEEVTVYKTTNFGLSTSGLEKFTAAANLELKDTELPSGLRPKTRAYNLNLSASPVEQYMASVSLNYIDDSQDGISNVTDLAYKAAPTEKANTDGKYTISSVRETFGSTDESVTKNTGSFKLDLRPISALRLRYYLKPNYTILNRTQRKSYNNETQQYEINVLPLPSLMLGTIIQSNKTMSIDKTDYPDYKRLGQSLDDLSYTYTLKAAPLVFMSTEFNYLIDDANGLNLLSPATLESYQKTGNLAREFNATIKTSLSERFAIDTGYSNKISKVGSGEPADNQTNTQIITESLKGIFNLNDFWTFSASYAYSKTTNFLSVSSQETYTLSPGIGFIFRYYDRLRVDCDYTISKSYTGSTTEKSLLSLRGKYDLSEYVHMTLRYEQEVSRAPDYKVTDFSGYVEINL
jgi:hypothetical protein